MADAPRQRILRMNLIFDMNNEADRRFLEAYDDWIPDGIKGQMVKHLLISALPDSREELDAKAMRLFREHGATKRRRHVGARKKKQAVATPAPAPVQVQAPVVAREVAPAPEVVAARSNDVSVASGDAGIGEFAGLVGGSNWKTK